MNMKINNSTGLKVYIAGLAYVIISLIINTNITPKLTLFSRDFHHVLLTPLSGHELSGFFITLWICREVIMIDAKYGKYIQPR